MSFATQQFHFANLIMRRSTRPSSHELTELNATAPENSDVAVSLAFPEGGREAWTCLLGSALIMFPSFGFQTAGKLFSKKLPRKRTYATDILPQWDPSRTTSARTN